MAIDDSTPITPEMQRQLTALGARVAELVKLAQPSLDAYIQRAPELAQISELAANVGARTLSNLASVADTAHLWSEQIAAVIRDGPLLQAFVNQQR